MSDARPLIAHVVYSFHTGGLENGLVNLINHLPAERFRHAVISLTTVSPVIRARIQRDDIEFIELNKQPGHSLALYPVLRRLFVQLAPSIVHTRNLAALEASLPAWLAGVPSRVHGEHGWDTSDPDGTRRKYRLMRRLYRPLVSQYVALSQHLCSYLHDAVKVPAPRIAHICNGVDTTRFRPAEKGEKGLSASPFHSVPGVKVIGTVGRQQEIKDPLNLLHAFAELRRCFPVQSAHLRLMMVGDGPLHAQLSDEVGALGLTGEVWLAGERSDVPEVMRAMDLFVLPSRAEGISNTILEAMATGLPVVATDVGGTPELIDDRCGRLVPPADSLAMADALAAYVFEPQRMKALGEAARRRAVADFSIDRMVGRYSDLYEQQLSRTGKRRMGGSLTVE